MTTATDDRGNPELVVLLDDQYARTGTAPKASIHTKDTPLHLAFSCYVFGPDGRVLLTRRALGKKTWPGVWTNSFCGHPGPGESIQDAVARRGRQELGIAIADPRTVLPDFRYTATDASGIVENEFCPVWTATVDSDPNPEPAEVCEWRWADWADLVTVADRMPYLLSPWAQLQIPRLSQNGTLPAPR
ncbi:MULTISPECIES: isopentenyl-diphosphate Delta-isomerase [Actinoalloteichus]|uniref:Isopentenyl-diphosphate Delta-isomerase n=1 Tax=Actinoalloteichus fjordicus TaxID=1612552 RepID=A0AAC9PTY6_9PSEU|nr:MULTISPECIES: isopentenyl-diphosphate Delta-isomerase [Actinoalloteichus]APU16643.1 isopentenyl-diphosphate delta-isomerase [Actinoalloteichus fjordicus]APU22709.1 isopentenyl-diphosphate delta-isomerase [Actinoalloteichus sp. GBA129-24]